LTLFVGDLVCQENEQAQLMSVACTATVEHTAYERIVAQSLFNTFPELGITHEAEKLEEGPVEIELTLRQSIITVLNEAGKNADAVTHLLFVGAEQALSQRYLCLSENWLAIAFKQEMQLPDEMADMGSLKQGYQTLWADPTAQGQFDSSYSQSPREVIDTFLKTKDLTHQWFNENIVSMQFDTGSGPFSLLIAVQLDSQMVCCYSVYPETIPKDEQITFASLTASLNYDLTFGNFELDFEDGELRFRTALPLNVGSFSVSALETLVSSNLDVMETHLPQLKATRKR